jgi:hypothetical protein
MLKPILIAAAVASTFSAKAEAATFKVFSNADAFGSALATPSFLEDFTDSNLQSGVAINGNRITYTGGALRQTMDPVTAPYLAFLFADGISAFGGDFDLTPGGVGQGFDVMVRYMDAAIPGEILSSRPAGSRGFYGFTSSAAISEVRFIARSGIETYTFDNLRFGQAAAVPEPATWAMMLGGFGLVGASIRRKRASSASLPLS